MNITKFNNSRKVLALQGSPPSRNSPLSEDILDQEWQKARIKGDLDYMAGLEEIKFREVERRNERWLKTMIKKYWRGDFYGLPHYSGDYT